MSIHFMVFTQLIQTIEAPTDVETPVDHGFSTLAYSHDLNSMTATGHCKTVMVRDKGCVHPNGMARDQEFPDPHERYDSNSPTLPVLRNSHL